MTNTDLPSSEADLSPATWRLLYTGHQDGATNMAIDEAILLGIAEGNAPPTLRFYGWQPPCVSIGYAQSLLAEVDLQACQERGYTWVRRPTGGRAVLHIDELTYSIAAPQSEPRVAGDILTSYRRLSQGLVAGLRRLGCAAVEAEAHPDSQGSSAACFDAPAHYEVTAAGRKLIGSAQVRRRGVVLQHGALPLHGDVSRLADVLRLAEPARARLRARLSGRAIALDEAVGQMVSFEQAMTALVVGLAQALNLQWQPGELSEEEQQAAARLRLKYGSEEWMQSHQADG